MSYASPLNGEDYERSRYLCRVTYELLNNLKDLPETVARKLPRYPLVPATLLGRLAVDEKHHGKGLGELLLMDALRRFLHQADVIGSAAVIVEAMDREAWKFYHNFDFFPFPNRRDRLFLPMATIRKLF